MGELVADLRRLRRAGDVPETLSESIDTVARFVGSFAPESSPLDEELALRLLGMELRLGDLERAVLPAAHDELPEAV